eukprot:CAMPEP_0204831284 /NCGR_PEP_ID=MMETSP1346-20131115/10318_1 /ASSEMBLY_ACC=CAM_ASM_000771 /TAXON_ID=215587 /ORGANISM="Aplanochytrium stocchinoi, Strain GSBS06" /LENGTH=350 /DNA_ID=CAMNT_0051962211 /DNA_START=230 /DNA_END=1282 /DNA_ORIENTATION=+
MKPIVAKAFAVSGVAQTQRRGLHGVYGDSERQLVKNLKGRNLLRIDDYSKEELKAMLSLSHHIKHLHKENVLPRVLLGKSVATIFQKRSTRTRVSAETGMGLLGGRSLFLTSEDMQLGVNESVKDTALVLSRFNDIILARVFGHDLIQGLDEHATVPVINALSDMHHPLQILADFMTIQEQFGPVLDGLQITWVGDGNNVLHDIMLAAPLMGVNCTVATPKGYEPHQDIITDTKKSADENGTSFEMFNDPLKAVKDTHVVVTDTWISMGQEEEAKKRLEIFKGYQVTMDMMNKGGANPAWKFMHCLPRHPQEVDDEVFYSDKSLVFDEAENRMYTVMAVMAAQLGHADFI